ncbi:GNAT family N-acetyltransferase [Pseudomonas knackmussii]|uniref:GNAT family N-acetyltransferase n=1 Tax=Pseudomonas knackmussii TaxID=65741 RepID=UPI003BBE6F08
MRLQWCRSLAAADFPRDDYEALRQRVGQATPFNRLGWLQGAEGALSPGQDLHVLLGWDGPRLVLCLPLLDCRERRAGLPFRVVRHLGYPLADRIALLIDAGQQAALDEVLQCIRRDLPHALLQLSELTAEPSQRKPCEAWAQASWFAERRPSCRAPVHRIAEDDRREPSGDLRYKLRKARRRCEEIGARVVRVCPDASSAPALIEAIAEVEQRSWKGDEGVGIFSGAQRRHWMDQALRGLAAENCLRVVLLEHDGRVISYRLGLFDQGRLYDYNLAFLPEYAALGAGRMLLDEWLRWGLEEGWQWLDASRVRLRGSNHQLHERQTGEVEHLRWSFYSRRPSGLALGLAYGAWRQLKPHLQRWRQTAPSAEPSP